MTGVKESKIEPWVTKALKERIYTPNLPEAFGSEGPTGVGGIFYVVCFSFIIISFIFFFHFVVFLSPHCLFLMSVIRSCIWCLLLKCLFQKLEIKI